MNNTRLEAKILSVYLIGEQPDDSSVQLYEQNVERLVRPWTSGEARLWRLCMRLPILLSLVDWTLALFNKYSPIRHRIFLMNCVLEAQPRFSKYFMP